MRVKKVKMKCGRETQNVPVKKIATIAKNVFHGHFSSRETKTPSYILGIDFSICLPSTNRDSNLNDFEGEDKDNTFFADFCSISAKVGIRIFINFLSKNVL